MRTLNADGAIVAGEPQNPAQTMGPAAGEAGSSPACTTEGGGWSACCNGNPMPWFRLAVGIFIAAQTMTIGTVINITPPDDPAITLLLHLGMGLATVVVAALFGWPLARRSAIELARGRITMELLFVAGIAGALGISLQSVFLLGGRGPVYFETINILLVIYSVGQAVSTRSRQRAVAAMESLRAPISMALLCSPGGDRLSKADTQEKLVEVASVIPGDCVRVLPGQMIPVDGIIVEGQSLVRQTPFTGQWVSVACGPGAMVLAGSACEDGMLMIRATAAGSQRRIDRLLKLIHTAQRWPTGMQRQADRLVRWFLPIVILISVATAIYWYRHGGNTAAAIQNALAVLLVACPCAAGLATPLAIWSAGGRLGRAGLLLQGSDALERLAEVDGVIFDKTGTLADQRLLIQAIATPDSPAQRARSFAVIAAIEKHSQHPVAQVLRDLPHLPDAPSVVVEAMAIAAGRGVQASVRIGGGQSVIASILRDTDQAADGILRLTLSIDQQWAATIDLVEQLRASAETAVESLRQMGLPVRIMTGDPQPGTASSQIAPATTGMSPQGKRRAVQQLGDDPQQPMRRPLFVGDGLNDAAAMAAAHASIALSTGDEVAIESASAVLRSEDLTLIPRAITLARRAVSDIRWNLFWAIAYNVVGIAAAASGLLHPVLAALLMAASSIVVAWRAMRLAERPLAAEDESGLATAQPPGTGYVLSHWVGLVGQGIVLGLLAGLPLWGTALVSLPLAAVAWMITRRRAHLSASTDMIMGMISIGGLGMNLGWWLDNIGQPAVKHCCAAVNTGLLATVGQSKWMYLGMLVGGIPAMYLLRRTPERFSWRRWCCIGPLLLGTPAMILGMWGAARLPAMLLTATPPASLLMGYLAMMAGMTAGMLLVHNPWLMPDQPPPGDVPSHPGKV